MEEYVECRICLEDGTTIPLENPCRCKGSVALYHQICMMDWLGRTGLSGCELCGVDFRNEIFLKKISEMKNELLPKEKKVILFCVVSFLIVGILFGGWFAYYVGRPWDIASICLLVALQIMFVLSFYWLGNLIANLLVSKRFWRKRIVAADI